MAQPQTTLCGGCAGITADAPHQPANRPGLPQVSVGLGSYSSFKRTQLAMLSSSALGKLSELRTRGSDDFSIALIDAWSTVGDTLSFYADRLANETLLATAVEPLSVRELARLVGYRPGPGVAAGAILAFTMSEAPGSPATMVVAAGAKVMSTPGQDQKPVTYETSATITARLAWNGIRPRLTQAHALPANANELSFAGVATGLKPGDGVWFVADDGQRVFAVIRRVTPHPADKAADPASVDTTAALIERVGGAPGHVPPSLPVLSTVPPPPAGSAALEFGQTIAAEDIAPLLAAHKLREEQLFAPYQALAHPGRQVLVLRRRASAFGHAAPALATLPEALIGQIVTYSVSGGVVTATGVKNGPFFGKTVNTWADAGTLTLLAGAGSTVPLDTTYDGVRVGSFAVIRDGAGWGLYGVTGVTEQTRNEFTVSAKATVLTLDSNVGFSGFTIRRASIFCDSEILPLAETPIPAAVSNGSTTPILLDGWYPGLQPGQQIALSGRAIGGGSGGVAELATLAAVEHVFAPGNGTRIKVAGDLARSYQRLSVRINANTVAATHGESVAEVLGSGDSRIPFQRFVAKQAPQTHLSAAVPGGAQPTLEVRVNQLLWHQVGKFLDQGPAARVYVTRVDAEGHTIVTFGDGVTGARLPTGTDNVRATYRKGLGLVGRVEAHQLNQPMTRPLGLAAVDNPLPSNGGADPQSGDSVRVNGPLTVRTLDRTVSLLDYEDYARAYAGVAKALAVPLWDAGGELVFVTVAGDEGAPIAAASQIGVALIASVRAAGDPYSRFALDNFIPAFFRLGAAVKIDPDHLADEVLTAVEAELRARFSFAARQFAQPVSSSEVMAAIHRVPGVVAARISSLHRTGTPGNFVRLAADPPRREANGKLRAAELLTLDPGPLEALEVMA